MNLFQKYYSPDCAGITQGAVYDCDDPVQPGVSNRLILGNLKDIATITYDVTDTDKITAITMATGKQCWAFEGYRQSLNPQYSFSPQALSSGYIHQVDFQVFDISYAQKKNLEYMALSKIFAVVENRNVAGNADNIFEVYGLGIGLEVTTLTRIARDLDTAGSFSVSLMTSDAEGQETDMPATWFITDYAATLAAVETLLTPAGP